MGQLLTSQVLFNCLSNKYLDKVNTTKVWNISLCQITQERKNFLNHTQTILTKETSVPYWLYESDASFALQPGKVVKGKDSIRSSLQTFTEMKGKLESKVKRVLKASDIALVITEWSFNGIGLDGKAVKLAGKATDVLRQQSDGSWRVLIDNPWGTE